jgi:hypothetical protein
MSAIRRNHSRRAEFTISQASEVAFSRPELGFRTAGPVILLLSRPRIFTTAHDRNAFNPAYQDADGQAASSCQAVSLSSWLQSGHRKMRISMSPPSTGTMATRFISAVQRQSGSSVEPATSSRSNFDMTVPRPTFENCTFIARDLQVSLMLSTGRRRAADRSQRGKTAGAVAQAGYLVPISLKHLILINARKAAFLFYFPKLPES